MLREVESNQTHMCLSTRQSAMKKKVLVVDDSALMRKHLKRILEGAGFEVELARDGQECLNKLPLFNPMH